MVNILLGFIIGLLVSTMFYAYLIDKYNLIVREQRFELDQLLKANDSN